MEQLAHIVERVQNQDQETNVKLMEWSKKKFQGKVNENIASEIALSQVELVKLIEKVKYLRIYSHCTKSCVISLTSHKPLARAYQPWKEI